MRLFKRHDLTLTLMRHCINVMFQLGGLLVLEYFQKWYQLVRKEEADECKPKLADSLLGQSIAIKHGFTCIKIRQVPWEVLITEAEGRGFQHLPRDLANVNALKNHVRSLLLHKSENICYISRYFLHYFVLPFHRCLVNAICTDYARSRAEQYTSHDGSNFVALVHAH